MPALTVQSGTVAIMGPPDKDGSFFARYTLTLSDGSAMSVDRPHELLGTNTTAMLAIVTANVNAQLAIVPSVNAMQLRRAINQMGLRITFEQRVVLANVTQQIAWYTAQTVNRDDPVVVNALTAIGQTSGQIDDLFRLAATL